MRAKIKFKRWWRLKKFANKFSRTTANSKNSLIGQITRITTSCPKSYRANSRPNCFLSKPCLQPFMTLYIQKLLLLLTHPCNSYSKRCRAWNLRRIKDQSFSRRIHVKLEAHHHMHCLYKTTFLKMILKNSSNQILLLIRYTNLLSPCFPPSQPRWVHLKHNKHSRTKTINTRFSYSKRSRML